MAQSSATQVLLRDRSSDAAALLCRVERLRQDANRRLAGEQRASQGQFLTPPAIAELMADLLAPAREMIRILDPGAGVGSLFAAAVAELVRRGGPVRRVSVLAYELDPVLAEGAAQALEMCREVADGHGVQVDGRIVTGDFLDTAHAVAQPQLWQADDVAEYDAVITNPPYRKIASSSTARALLRLAGIEVSNLYAGFLALAARQLATGGEMVAICPRSFCNGPYFGSFRKAFLADMALQTVHLIEDRDVAFQDGDVLQECVIFRAVRHGERGDVLLRSAPASGGAATCRRLAYDAVVRPTDADAVIHLPATALDDAVSARLAALPETLGGLGLGVSTGRVVEFRARDSIQAEPGPRCVPLVHPANVRDGRVVWPASGGRRPQAIRHTAATADLLAPNGIYVLVKRFTSKEQPRRVVAAVHRPADVPGELVGFENHLNVIHSRFGDLDPLLASGLAAYLNSTLLDLHFRQFSGHTQVNAADLRKLPWPRADDLRRIGQLCSGCEAAQAAVDQALREVLYPMETHDPVLAQARIEEAQAALTELGLPAPQRNRLSALTLLAFLDLGPADAWQTASMPLRGIDQVIEFVREHYGIEYATGTRESIRRESVHQFLQAGLLVKNPDQPDRPTNSPRTVYQVEPGALTLLQSYGSPDWQIGLRVYRATQQTLATRYAQERVMPVVPVRTPQGDRFSLAAGEHNELIREVVESFAPRFTPGATVLYAGDAAGKFAYYPEAARQQLADLGIAVDVHGQMPDVMLYHAERNWLVLVEAVTSHGPVDPKRKQQLQALFEGCRAALVFVTAFHRRDDLLQHLRAISWETEVWLAESPTHLIHFDGEHYLGPPALSE